MRNIEYEKRVHEIIIRALLSGLINEDRQVVLMSGELTNVFLMLIAAVTASSARCDTPQKIRLFSEECAKSLASKIKAFKDCGEESIFETIREDTIRQ